MGAGFPPKNNLISVLTGGKVGGWFGVLPQNTTVDDVSHSDKKKDRHLTVGERRWCYSHKQECLDVACELE